MADVNANIGVNIDTSDALNQLKSLQRQISQFHQSVAKSSSAAAVAQRDLQKNFINGVNAIQGFSAELRTVRTSAETFTNSLEKNKFSIQQYFRYAASQTKTFGKNFTSEFATIEKTALERVKTLQTQYVKMGRDANGAMQAIAIRPTVLNMQDLGTQTAIAAQKQVLFNQLVKQGSTNLLNFGKNTQWAGRQLMVGFTLPLATLGMTAGRVFMDMEKAAIKFKKVYGDLFTAPAETEQALDSIVQLGIEYTKYGVAVSDAVSVASDAAAAGFQGVDLQNQTTASLKLSVLGQMELQKALETTIALQNAFRISSADLAGTIDFLNAVENQTVVSLDDITEAVPRVAPVIQSLGGDVKDLAFFLAAMKEGGVNAAQGANALKSGLASLINPTERAAQMLGSMGINIRGIVSQNQGDLRGTVVGFAQALDQLDPMKRAQAIEQLFGKFQFARISALFDNVIKEGSQASRVLDLAGSSLSDLAELSDKELGVSAASAMNKFRAAIEQVKVALAPLGELFLEIATPFVDFATKVLNAFNNLPDGIKKIIGTVITVVGGLGPILLMTFGLINNGIANMIKFFATVRLGYLKMTGQAKGIGDETQYMTQEQLEAAAAAASLDQAHAGLTQRFTAEKTAVDALRDAYSQAAAAGARFASINPGMMKPGSAVQKFANGGFVSGSGSGDTVPAMLTPGEFVVKKKEAQVFMPLLQAINEGKVPGFYGGGTVPAGGSSKPQFAHVTDMTRTSIGQFDKIVKEQGIEISRGVRNWLDQLLAINKDIELLVGTGFGFDQKGSINTKMRSGGAASVSEFQEDFKSGGIDKWKTSVKFASESFNDVESELRVYDAELSSAVDKWAELNNKTEITSQEFAKIERAVRDNILDPTGKLKLAIDKAEAEIHEIRANLSQAQLNQAGYKTVEVPSRTDPSRMSATKRVVDPQGNKTMLRTSGNSKEGLSVFGFATREQMGVAPKPVESEAAGNADMKAYLNGRRKALGLEPKKDIFEETRKRNSPHELAVADGRSDGKAYQTAFVQEASSVPRKGPRRFSTDPDVMAALTGTSQAQVNTPPRASRRATREADSTAPAEKIWQKSTENVSGFSDKVSKAAFAMSSVTGILSVFGADLGGILPIISATTGALFGIIEISKLLVGTKIAEIAATRLLTAAKTQGAVGDIASAIANGRVADMFGSMFVKGKGLAGFFTNVGKAAMTLLRGFGLIGLAITALAVGIPLIVKAFEDNANRVNGLGAAANLTEDKLNFLAEKFNVTAKSINWAERSAAAQATAGKSTEEKEQVVDLMIDPQFAEKFKTEIAGIKDATKEQGNLALESLATQLRNSGFESEAVDAIVAAIVAKTGRTDLNLKFNSVLIDDANSAKAAADLATRATESYSKAAKDAIARAQAAAEEGVNTDNVEINLDYEAIRQDPKILQETKAAAGVAKTSIDSLTLAFENGSISSDIYSQSLTDLFNNLLSAEQPTWMLQNIAESMGLKDLTTGLTDARDVAMIIQAVVAGTGELPSEDELKALRDAAADPKNTKLEEAARKVRDKYAKATANATKEQQQFNNEKVITNNLDEANAEADAIQAQIDAYNALVTSGMNAELAYRLVGDAAQVNAIQQAMAQDATNGNTAALQAYISAASMIDGKRKEFAALAPSGGGQKSAFQEAIDSLKEQQKEAKNSITTYAKLRSAGLGVAEASKIAGDSMLAAALASQQVGSRKWNELVTAIRAARAEEEAWLNSTPEGRAEQFAEVYGKVMDVFSAQEAVLEMNNQAATAANKKIIETLEKQIDAYQRRSSELERDLNKIAEKEDEINKAYDEKTKALETVKKLNQDIINQQKSQLSIADALSRGDISAAASAMQDARAQSAASQGDAMGTALDAARQSQLEALTQNGKTRAQIEAEIKRIKQDISNIEFGALQNARDAVAAADEALETAKETYTVQGQTRTQWENINTQIEASKANAFLYDVEVVKALENAKGLVGEWSKLQDTFTTTHVINTVNTSNNASGAPAATTPVRSANTRGFVPTRSGMVGPMSLMAKGGMVKPAFFAAGGFAKGTDTVPAMLTPGEFVVNSASTKRFAPILEAMNSGSFRYSTPTAPAVPNNFSQPIYNMPERTYSDVAGSMSGQSSSNNSPSLTAQDNSVYNYSLSVNVEGTNASANDIANVVMNKIKTIDSQQVRRQVLR
jgi:TP901 family phage tail tape measure protein